MGTQQQTVSGAGSDRELPLREAQSLVRGLMTPDPRIYWADFLFHVSLGWGAFFAALQSPAGSLWQLGGGLIAVLSLYRAVIFIHELAHLRKGRFRIFRFVWNLLCGIPLLVPSFTYDGVHNEHHRRNTYGTAGDGEYIPFTARGPRKLVTYVLTSFLLPWFFVLRFLVLTPLSWVIRPLREVLWARASSLVIDTAYRRPHSALRHDRNWRVQEFSAFAFAAAVVTGVSFGVLPARIVFLWYGVTATIFLLNSLRTMAAHTYRNPPDHRLTVAGQYLDSTNIPGHALLTPLWAPVGLRFHATHHLFPAMPYHNLGRAHRLLMSKLSDRELYRQTLRRGLWDALRRLWKEAREAQQLAYDAPPRQPPQRLDTP